MADVTLESTERPPDGVECSAKTTWLLAHNGSGESLETEYLAGIERREVPSPTSWYGWRMVMFFDLSSVKAYDLESVVLTLKPTSAIAWLNGDLVCVQATSVTYGAIVLADYADLASETTEYGRITEADWNYAQQNLETEPMTINAAGLAYIRTRAGSTLVLGFRSSYDIDNTAQTGDCKPFIWSTTTLPSLAITYDSYPSDPIMRVTGLVHRWRPGEFTLETLLGDTRTQWEHPTVTKAVKYKEAVGPPAELYPPPTFEELDRRIAEARAEFAPLQPLQPAPPPPVQTPWQRITPWREERGETFISAAREALKFDFKWEMPKPPKISELLGISKLKSKILGFFGVKEE